jgi:hypothetical protein
MARPGALAPQTESTYQAVEELVRSGMPTTKAALQALADRTGEPVSRLSARYYSAKKRVTPAAPARAPRAAKANGAATIPPAPGLDLVKTLRACAAMLEELAAQVEPMERDAAQWRTVAAMLQRQEP